LEVGVTNDYFLVHASRSVIDRIDQDGDPVLLHGFSYDPTARRPSWTRRGWRGWTASRSPE
jgi:hypothetical protein